MLIIPLVNLNTWWGSLFRVSGQWTASNCQSEPESTSGPRLFVKGPRLFGLENESPDDLHNIFYRNVRYCIYINRKKAHIPSLKYFTTLIRDELKLKFRGTRILTKVKSDSDKTSLNWLRIEMGWSSGIHIGHPLINPYPNSQTRTR